MPIKRKAVTLGIVAMILSLSMLAGCASNASKPDASGSTNASSSTSTATSDTSTPQGLYESKCSACHSLSTVDNATYKGADQWAKVVKSMQAKTKDISDDDAKTITDYLANR